jgi:CheY-like chemotaxis protein
VSKALVNCAAQERHTLARLSQRTQPVPPAAQLWTTGRFDTAAAPDDGIDGRGSGLAERPSSGQVRTAQRLRVLVLEPAAVLRNIMGHALSVQGYEVRSVDRVAGLAQRIASFDPHLVVCEAALQDGSGEQVCRELQGQGGKLVPVILMSGMPEPELEARAKAAGADRAFCKARGLSRLLDLIDELTSEILY